MNYEISLKHDDFIMLLHILRSAKEAGITNWNAAEFLCQHTKVVFDDVEFKKD